MPSTSLLRSAPAVLMIATALVAGTGSSASAAGAETIRFQQVDPVVTEALEPCGAILSYVGTHSVMVHFDEDGKFVRAVQQDRYTGTITYEGTSYTANDRQVHLQYLGRDDVPIGVLNGQGLFTHLPGVGVAFFDVGHLVFNDETGETLMRSSKVVGLDQEYDFGAAICAALTEV